MLLREFFAIVDGSRLRSLFGAGISGELNAWLSLARSVSQKEGRSGITDEFGPTPRVTAVVGPDPAIARLDFHEENRRQALQRHQGVVDIR